MKRSDFLMRFLLIIVTGVLVFVPGGLFAQASIPRPEHPRPDFMREQMRNLNGQWDFLFDPEDVGKKEKWFMSGAGNFQMKITVPFPWESPLSGIQRPDYKGAAWYRRIFSVPSDWAGHRVLLTCCAIDWEAEVWVNGKRAGSHEGGYSPFSLDISEFLNPEGENVLVIRAFDDTSPYHPHGKQVGWYTRTSGIWQTVYLEAVPSASRMLYAHVQPDIDNQRLYWTVGVENAGPAGNYVIALESADDQFPRMDIQAVLNKGINDVAFDFPFRNGRLWTLEEPYLYFVNVSLKQDLNVLDKVQTYFGYRKISAGSFGDNPYQHILLNNKPVYLMGALNQAFNPRGIYTYQSDDAIKLDVERAKEFGFNFLRIHIKVDEPRLYYWADRLGLLIMSDMPNFRIENDLARRAWEHTFRDAVQRDFNHPSIFSWCLFNETWGLNWQRYYAPKTQKWVEDMYFLAKRLDPTRLIEDNSPCRYDHVKTDINSWHFYINDYELARVHIRGVVEDTYPGSFFNFIGGNQQGNQPLMNSEYGGISAGSGDRDISWCFKYLTNELRLYEKICGYIYTELQDIEWEHNGFMDYDRQPKDFGYEDVSEDFSYRDINSLDFVVIDKEPCPTVAAGENFFADIYFSHYSGKAVNDPVLRWKLTGTDNIGEKIVLNAGSQPISVKPYRVIKVATISFQAPCQQAVGTLTVRIEDDQGNKIAQNYINVDVYKDVQPRVETPVPGSTLVRFDPRDYIETTFKETIDEPASGGEKVSGLGVGKFRYDVKLPDGLNLNSVTALSVLFEGAARAGFDKVDARFRGFPWTRNKPTDYPQTDITKCPTDVTVSINGIEIQIVNFTDDPADARGILSHAHDYDPGSYGYLTRVNPTPEQLASILAKLRMSRYVSIEFRVKEDAINKNGLAIFGDRLGRYAVDPTLVFQTDN